MAKVGRQQFISLFRVGNIEKLGFLKQKVQKKNVIDGSYLH